MYTGSPYQLTAHVAISGYADAGTLDFDVEIAIDCSSTTLSTLAISDMSYSILETSYSTQTLPDLTDTVSDLMGDAAFCGNRIYSIESIIPTNVDYSPFLSLDPSTKIVTLGDS